eukprot:CAMPEP_0175071454 /NCGR_PEP_ID=MMETSP0052_2-20121109/19253_1 /TAXON_ID=51329 ORGANISM="Polytomella parva, Strain SAG 63-3" /NCGR_SAMPLE_ID=MMETSP0052_2 /ASSEMBLY_ACC=CAM_ASM_000194 /LENGTH=546 /DNA_ID=CAMNT_0016338629 /DNA_START=56 /DNA_END=1693 /DNA_ORIENTATION=+
MSGDSPALKRAKTEPTAPAVCVTDVINHKLLTPESRAGLHATYQAAKPYRHTVLKDVFNIDLLKKVKDEIISNIQATYKETDLFKVFQTGDIGNLDSLDSSNAVKLPSLYKLKSALYSSEFRDFITDITGCGNLSSRIDCSCNVYANGGHLLCHDDVIGKRRVSWIIYLTDPDTLWEEKDGGALELYPPAEGQQYVPDVVPSLSHLPIFNTMAMFTVLPGYSFHSVQEVFSEDCPRMSISGWYHTDTEIEGMEHATLNQLQFKSGEDTTKTYTSYASEEDTNTSVTEKDRELLSRWVNDAYLGQAGWGKILEKFKEDGSVQLKNFLKKDIAAKIAERTKAEDESDAVGRGRVPNYQAGVSNGWKYVGPPHKQRYLRYSREEEGREKDDKTAGELLAEIRHDLFETGAFARLLREMTTITYLGHQGEVRRFRAGLDYTVAHYGIITKDPRLDVVLTFVDDATKDDATTWDSGEMGGFEAYLLAETDDESAAAAEVYRPADADESGVLNVSACSNTLNIVLRDEGLMRFVKYVSYGAPGSRWDVAMEF